MKLSAAHLGALYYWSLPPAERCRGELDGGSSRTWEVRILDEVVPDILADEAQIDMEFGVSGDPPQASNAVRLVKLLVWSRADRPGYKREWGPELTRE